MDSSITDKFEDFFREFSEELKALDNIDDPEKAADATLKALKVADKYGDEASSGVKFLSVACDCLARVNNHDAFKRIAYVIVLAYFNGVSEGVEMLAAAARIEDDDEELEPNVVGDTEIN